MTPAQPAQPEAVHALTNFCNNVYKELKLRSPDLQQLNISGNDKASFQRAYALFTNKFQTICGETLQYTVQLCSICQKEFAGLGLGDQQRHFRSCHEAQIKSLFSNKVAEEVNTAACPVVGCQQKKINTWNDLLSRF